MRAGGGGTTIKQDGRRKYIFSLLMLRSASGPIGNEHHYASPQHWVCIPKTPRYPTIHCMLLTRSFRLQWNDQWLRCCTFQLTFCVSLVTQQPAFSHFCGNFLYIWIGFRNVDDVEAADPEILFYYSSSFPAAYITHNQLDRQAHSFLYNLFHISSGTFSLSIIICYCQSF